MAQIYDIEIKHFHGFCGIGGGAKGFNQGKVQVGALRAKSRCLGGVDVDPAVIREFDKQAGVKGTVLDMFSAEQYRDFHGKEPPQGWREATPADIRKAAGNERPNILFLSPPCKGFSGLCSPSKAATAKYRALNKLTLRGIWLMLEAWSDDPPEFVLMENVPMIQSRGRHLLDEIVSVLRHFGYAVRETKHDCGEIGGLGATRKRFLLIARHAEKIPPHVYVPQYQGLKSVGDVLGRMPLPGHPASGLMHRMPRLQWQTWVRLALIPAGKDWRSLRDLRVSEGLVRDFVLVPEKAMYGGVLGVHHWEQTLSTVTSKSRPMNGAFAIADPRHEGALKHSNEFSVAPWDAVGWVVTSAHGSGQVLADPRCTEQDEVMRYRVKSAAQACSDSRKVSIEGISCPQGGFSKYRVTGYDQTASCVIAGSTSGEGAFAIADVRVGMNRKPDVYATAGHYGVKDWGDTANAVTSSACYDNGFWSVADTRLPKAREHTEAYIVAADGTYHRPITTLELAALQGLIEPEEYLQLEGKSDQDWREWIGNLVPPKAAKAIFEVIGQTYLLAKSGQSQIITDMPVWVRPVAASLSLPNGSAVE